MAKVLKMEDIKKAIVDYVNDDRKTQAVLLDGVWGCGKTFFVKEHLIPTLKKNKNSNIFQVSLYGISDVEMIQEQIYAQWLEACAEEMAEKLGLIGQLANKSFSILSFLGKPAIRAAESKMGAEGASKEVLNSIAEKFISKNSRNIIIFDDIERCRIDIIQLMGFLNNLSENNGFKLILIANEKEINRTISPTEEALKYLVAINYKAMQSGNAEKAGKDVEEADTVYPVDDLQAATTKIFGEESQYERTREKLIGLTIPYSISISEAFGDVVKKYISIKNIRSRVINSQDSIIKILDEYEHRNLRTLISACIVIQDILMAVNLKSFSNKDLLEIELNTVILYSVYSAIRKSTGTSLFQWPSNTRYTCVNSSLWDTVHTKVYGYAFVDEYWKTQCADPEVIMKDISDRINYCIETEQSRQQSQEHYELALYKLNQWYLLEDDDVKNLIKQMKSELEQQKYHPNEFKEIVLTLMRINNPNFGMRYGENSGGSGSAVYESTEENQFKGMEHVEAKICEHIYTDWDEINIKEFVELMVAYFDDHKFTLTKDMIRVLAEDKQFTYDYRMLTLPLLEMVDQHRISEVSKDEDGNLISDLPWDESLRFKLKDNSDKYLNQGRFLSLFDYDKLKDHIVKASASEIYYFCDALRSVYSFSNLNDAYSSDLEIVSKVYTFVEENYGKHINSEKSRTKEIAFKRLREDLRKYRKSLGYVEEPV